MDLNDFIALSTEARSERLAARQNQIDTLTAAQDCERIAHAAALMRDLIPGGARAAVRVSIDADGWFVNLDEIRNSDDMIVWEAGEDDDLPEEIENWIEECTSGSLIPVAGIYRLDLLTGRLSGVRD